MSIRLRDNADRRSQEPYPLGEFPKSVIDSCAEYITYLLAVGRTNISGDDWGDAFARAIGGTHLNRPLGIADVTWKGMAFSTKTVSTTKRVVAEGDKVSLISGRNSPTYSADISDPFADIQRTGDTVLRIWNQRVQIASDHYRPLRTVVLQRNMRDLSFTMFEEPLLQFDPHDYEWRLNSARNFQGFVRDSNIHRFTWQPHGSQFTIQARVPAEAVNFKLRRPPQPDIQEVLQAVDYQPSWVTVSYAGAHSNDQVASSQHVDGMTGGRPKVNP